MSIACQDCGTNHYFEWELLRDNLEQMLTSGEPRPHEPAFDLVEDEYIQWDYGKGYVDAVADAGLEPDKRIEVTQCPWCETPFDGSFAFCPACGRTLATVRLYRRAARPRLRRARRTGPARPRGLRALLDAAWPCCAIFGSGARWDRTHLACLGRGKGMARFMFKVSYTKDGMQGVMKEGAVSRRTFIEKMASEMAGRSRRSISRSATPTPT